MRAPVEIWKRYVPEKDGRIVQRISTSEDEGEEESKTIHS